jgi:hypothetical protein
MDAPEPPTTLQRLNGAGEWEVWAEGRWQLIPRVRRHRRVLNRHRAEGAEGEFLPSIGRTRAVSLPRPRY